MSVNVYILVLTWNQKDVTCKFLKNLRNLTYPSVRTIVVENGSTDGTACEIRKNFPEVILLDLPHNTGCAGGRNIGIDYFLKKTDGKYLFFLDNDIEAENDFIEKTLDVFKKNDKAGIVGGVVYYRRTDIIHWAGATTNWLKGRFKPIARDNLAQDTEIEEVDGVPGATTLAKREVFERVPRIDEDYFIYYEDPDWSLKVLKNGYKILFVPYLKFYHYSSSSLGMESPSFYYYRVRNRLRYFYRNGSKSNFVFFFVYFLFWNFPYETLSTLYLSGKSRQLKASMFGVLDFVRGNFGKRNFEKENDEFFDKPILICVSRCFDRWLIRQFGKKEVVP